MVTIWAALFYLLQFIKYAILARVIISWLPISNENIIISMIYQITEPVLAPVRRLLEKTALGGNMMFDFSPILVFLFIDMIQRLL